MAKLGRFQVSVRGWLAASVVAPALTLAVASVFLYIGETVPWLVNLSRATPSEQAVFQFVSLPASLIQEGISLLTNILLGPFLSVPLGFTGATIFLLPAFATAEVLRLPWRFALAGGIAGAAFAISGALLTPHLKGPLVWLALVLGYFPFNVRLGLTLAVGSAAIIAGFIAGLTYGRLRRGWLP